MKEILEMPPIELEWSEWHSWFDVERDARYQGGVSVPNKQGVYEARLKNQNERLTIGKASDLRMRVKQGLVKGKTPHSTGQRIRASEDVSEVVVRWAITDRPAAAEEELHLRYKAKFDGRLPKHTKNT